MENENLTNLVSEKLDEKWFRGVRPNAKKHLLSSLQSLERLQAPTPSFKLYGKSDISVATDFIKLVEGKTNLPDWLIPYELSRLEKFGPQGGHAPWSELRDNAVMYFSRCQTVEDSTPLKEMNQKYAQLDVHMLSVKQALSMLKDDDKIKVRAAGWRDFDLKKTDAQAQRDAIQDAQSGIWKNGWGYFFSRYNKKKKRLFVPMPFSNMIKQAQYFNPFLKRIQDSLRDKGARSPFVFWADKIGFGPCFTKIMAGQFEGEDPSHIVYAMRDFEKMDTTTGESQKRKSFIPKLASALHFKPGTTPYKEMEEAILFSNRCPIATPEGMWIAKESHGEASGATVTNGGETCCNEDYNHRFNSLLAERCAARHIKYHPICHVGNGDDGQSIYYLDDLEKFDEFKRLIAECANIAASEFGFRVQGDKWDVVIGHGKYCQYLNYYDGREMKFMYPAVLILNSIVNPEKEYTPSTWDKDYRDLDIIEKLDNGEGLPYFHELIDYVDNGMKYHLLGQSEEETRRILLKFNRYRALQDESRKFNFIDEERESDISKSPTINYLLSKRGEAKLIPEISKRLKGDKRGAIYSVEE